MTRRLSGLALAIAVAVAVALVLAAPAIASAASVDITGPTNLTVPYDNCVQATWNANASFSPTFTEWSWNGSVVSTAGSYSRWFCSPNLDYATNEFATVSVYVSNGSTSAYDSLNVNVVYGTSCGLPMC